MVTRIICLCKTHTLLKICDDTSGFNNFPIQGKREHVWLMFNSNVLHKILCLMQFVNKN